MGSSMAFMGLEHWDSERRKYVLYRSQVQHRHDSARFPFESIPRRVFLDTNVVNLLVKHRVHIFDREPIFATIDPTSAVDIEALMHIFAVGSRADWDIVGSPKTLDEIYKTKNADLRGDLLDYGGEIVDLRPDSEDRRYALDFGRRLIDTTLLDTLPDVSDRELIGHAVALRCDAFCTCDRATILNKRSRLPRLPLQIMEPSEWWAHIRPWAGLWC